ncbi:nuclear transport factor 2 family protein [Pseudonocardia asaccharolytica]|uniref:nuclear transport factor 2 family protein n=1 Tax=Pseudonocardia asaccharolytica TaxID=54010 RepID=UPI0011BD448C
MGRRTRAPLVPRYRRWNGRSERARGARHSPAVIRPHRGEGSRRADGVYRRGRRLLRARRTAELHRTRSAREVCRRGLDASSGAVAWGLDRARAEQPDGEVVENWSRGTRVFQRRDGEWVMSHRHLSFPYDPQTGEARTDLRP